MKTPTLVQLGKAILMLARSEDPDNVTVATWLTFMACTTDKRLEARLDGASVAEASKIRFRHQPNNEELQRILDQF